MGLQIQRTCTEEIRMQSLNVLMDIKRELQAHRWEPSDWRRPESGCPAEQSQVHPEPPPAARPAFPSPPGGAPPAPLRRSEGHLMSSLPAEWELAFKQPEIGPHAFPPRDALPSIAGEPMPPLPCEVPVALEVNPCRGSLRPRQSKAPGQDGAAWHKGAFGEGHARDCAGGERSDAGAGSARPLRRTSTRSCPSTPSRLAHDEDRSSISKMSLAFPARPDLCLNRKTRRTPVRRLSLGMQKATWIQKAKGKTFWNMTARELLLSSRFDNLVGCLILLNAATIGWQADYAARNVTEDFPVYFTVVERVFCVLFTFELLLRMYVHKLRFFCPPRKAAVWNYFDLFVVTAQLTEEALHVVANSNSVSIKSFRLLRILRILRLVRILRVVRVLHLIAELRTILSSIAGSFKSLAWTVVLLSLIIYIVGVYFTSQVTEYLVDKAAENAEITMEDQSLSYYFRSLVRALLSLWEAMSGGADWDSMVVPLIGVSPLMGVAFAAYIAFALLALMNVVTGVFVQTALQNAKDEEDIFLTNQIMKLFEIQDRERKQKITLAEIEARLRNPDTAGEWQAVNVQPAEAKYLFDLLDIDGSGEIGFEEFLGGCLRLHGCAKSFDLLTVLQEHRTSVKDWDAHFEELHRSLGALDVRIGGLEVQASAAAQASVRSSSGLESALQRLGSSQDRECIVRVDEQLRSQAASLSTVKHMLWSLGDLLTFVNDLVMRHPSACLGLGVPTVAGAPSADIDEV